jgi:hypothetical protein
VASVPSLGVAVPTTKDNPPAATPLLSLLETIANQVVYSKYTPCTYNSI